MPISITIFRNNGVVFQPVIPLPPPRPHTIIQRPIIRIENDILTFLRRNRNLAFTLNEIMTGIEGNFISPHIGLFYTIAIGHLIRSRSIECRDINGNFYYTI